MPEETDEEFWARRRAEQDAAGLPKGRGVVRSRAERAAAEYIEKAHGDRPSHVKEIALAATLRSGKHGGEL